MRLTPHLIELIYDAALKSYWTKGALTRFLSRCGIAEHFLSTWRQGETKRAFLDRLFPELQRTEEGKGRILQMGHYLMDQTSFPDLANWEDSKHKIRSATEAVESLRAYITERAREREREERAKESRKATQARQQDTARNQRQLQELNERLTKMVPRMGTQEAGYLFQDYFYDLMHFYDVNHKKPYTAQGRQIDGSITVDGTTYLIELKFTADQAGAPDVDTFMRKVTTKADNTMGIMVSISGYSTTAIEEASRGQSPILLMDHSHIIQALRGIMNFSEIVERVRRHASQTGQSYLPANAFGN